MKRSIALVASLLLLGLPTGRAAAGNTLDDVKKRGILVAGVNGTCRPFGFMDGDAGALCGYDVDFVRAVAARLGVRAVLTPVTEANRIPELVDGKIDLVAATMSRTSDRAKIVDFSDSYFVASQKLLARKGAARGAADLKGKRIGTAGGSGWEAGLAAVVPEAVTVAFDSSGKAAEALRAGRIDAISADRRILAALLGKLPPGQFDILPLTVSEERYQMAVRKGDRELLAAVNATIREMAESGEAERIGDRWFGAGPASPGPAATAAGVVMRRSAEATRFVVMPIKGTFTPGAAVSFFDPRGSFVAKGWVKSFYTDEIYVDIDPAGADAVDYGFVVVMNMPEDAARDLILRQQALLKSVTDDIRAETIARQERIAANAEETEKQRRKEQVDFERLKMQLDYVYDRYYYRWYW